MVRVEGDEAIAASIRAYLTARDIATSGTSECGVLEVHVLAERGMVRVVLKDTVGQADSRLVTDSATASVFVESRVRSDLALELPSAEPSSVDTERREPATQVEGEYAPLPSATVGSRSVPASVRFRPGFSMGNDGSSWLDFAVSGCVQLDAPSVGATLRGSLDLGVSGRSADLPTERAGLDALVGVEFPFRVGQSMQLSPGFGAGAGWLRVGPRGTAEPPPGAEVSADFGGLRLDATVRVSWRIADRWGLGVAAYGILDPLAHSGDIRDPDALLAGNPVVRAGAAFELEYGAP
ncbi:MAG: hypothetical protein R3B13_27560 [Polyangiaceae bacterium]